MKTPLCELFEKYGADKCPTFRHSYSPAYFEILAPYSNSFTDILEIGIGTPELMQRYLPQGKKYLSGASLRGWQEFFPQAKIYGIDIEESILFEEDRIKCFYTDQSSAEELENTIAAIREYSKLPNQQFDLILDDGSHIISHMVTTFDTLGKYVKPGGFYIIEDIKEQDLMFFTSLPSADFRVVYTHVGNDSWDGFVAYQKTLK